MNVLISIKNKKSPFLRGVDIFALLLNLMFCILYPGWVKEGYLNTWYLKIAVGIAAYGGFIGTLIWLYRDIKKRGW